MVIFHSLLLVQAPGSKMVGRRPQQSAQRPHQTGPSNWPAKATFLGWEDFENRLQDDSHDA